MSIIINLDQLPISSDISYGCETLQIDENEDDTGLLLVCDYCSNSIDTHSKYYHYIFTDMYDYYICITCHDKGINFCSYSDQLFDEKDTFKLYDDIYIHKKYSGIFDDFNIVKSKKEYLESIGITESYNNRILIEPGKIDNNSKDDMVSENEDEIEDEYYDHNIQALLSHIKC